MRTMVMALVVVGCGEPDPRTVTIEAPGASLVAFQDGDGPWQPLAPDTDGHVEVTSVEGFYGVARICPDLGGPGEDPTFRGAVDLRFDTHERTFGLSCPTGEVTPSSLLSGATSPGATISVDQQQTMENAGAYSIRVRNGTFDVVATQGAPPRILIVRDVEFAADRTLDLAVADEGIDMPIVTPIVTGADPAEVTVYADLNTNAGRTYAFLGSNPTTVAFAPPSLLVEGDGAAVGASAHGCIAQRPAAATMDLAIPAAPAATVDRSGASFTFDPAIDWELVRLILTEQRTIAAARIVVFADLGWLAAHGATDTLPLDDVALGGASPDIASLIADGAMVRADFGILRGEFDGDLDECSVTSTFAW